VYALRTPKEETPTAASRAAKRGRKAGHSSSFVFVNLRLKFRAVRPQEALGVGLRTQMIRSESICQ